MINNNKILTVSYGTFSCTLEGFDDSFGTMKAIAEYFRDLASDDRYFGAEPPQPDAEMLARIAQKEISRRVEAHEHDGRIALRALADTREAQPEAEAPQPAAVEAADAPAPVETPIAAAPEEPAEEAPAPVAAPEPEAAAEAEDIAEIDAPAQIEDTPDVETQEAQDTAEADQTVVLDDGENDIVPGQPDAEVEAFFEGTDTAEDTDDAPTPTAEDEEAAADQAEPNSIAAKLQRIRAVVAQQGDEVADDPYSEDEHADAGAAARARAEAPQPAPEAPEADEDNDVIADARREIEEALEADDAIDTPQEASDAVSDEEVDDIAAILARMELDADEPEAEAVSPDPQPAAESVSEEDTLVADLMAQTAADAQAETAFEPEDETPAPAAPRADQEAAAPKLSATSELRLETEVSDAPQEASAEAPARPRARVIKVKRADLDAAIARGDLEEYDEDEDETPLSLDDLAPAKTAQSSLSAEEEDELARELAALEEDIKREQGPLADDIEDAQDLTEDVSAEALAEAPEDVQADVARPMADIADAPGDVVDDITDTGLRPRRRAQLPSIDDAQGDNMDRLLAETNQQMGEPESATRRDAFAHLRAAVAAKKADEALGNDPAEKAADGAYRNDLADAVRPRRPAAKGGGRTRPSESRPAPLKLVAEQRIDVARPASDAPVRPRRVAAVAAAPAPTPEGEESFAEFAAEMGATKLPDLLEAAAAYMAFVEGREQFSRPQLMTKVRQAGADPFSREDTLRSFGKLLRDGKIEKIKGGRFTASEDIGFRPDQRAAS